MSVLSPPTSTRQPLGRAIARIALGAILRSPASVT